MSRLSTVPRAVGALGLGLYLVIAHTPFPAGLARAAREPVREEPAGAIVVLGGRIRPDGTLGESSLRRALEGILLYRRGRAPILVLSGESPATGPSEAQVRADLARDLGVPPEAIVPIQGARTTREEATRVGEALQRRGVRRILLVTDSQHLPRARLVFERAGFTVLGAPSDKTPGDPEDSIERLDLMRRLLQEFVARAYYHVVGYL